MSHISTDTWSPSSNEADLLEGGGLVIGPNTWSPSSNEADLLEGGGVIYSIDDLMSIVGGAIKKKAKTKAKKKKSPKKSPKKKAKKKKSPKKSPKVRGGGTTIKCRKGYGYVNFRYRNINTGNCVSKKTATGH
jgi:hypothetical protein